MANVNYSESSQVSNQTLTLADTEYPVTIPDGCKGMEFQCRTAFDVRYAFVTGKVAGSVSPYMTLKSGYTYAKDKLYLRKQTLYLASSQAGVVVEITFWL